MKKTHILAGIMLAGAMAACQSQENISVADYCANPDRANENVCQLHVELNGTRTALSSTDLRLSEARKMADNAEQMASDAMTSAKGAHARADDAMHMAEDALRAANTLDNLYCETNTINKTNIGTCPANFRLMSCTQTRYTHRAGGLSFLREIDDEMCRFNERVLEMKVRCCTVASNRPVAAQTVSRRPNVSFTPVPQTVSSSDQPTSATAQRVYNQTIGNGS